MLIATVHLRQCLNLLPQQLVVMAIHFHYVTAKGEHGKRKQRDEFMEQIVCKIKEHEVTCLMMDANAILLKLVGFIRSGGIVIDVCATRAWIRVASPLSIALVSKSGQGCMGRRSSETSSRSR